VGIDQRFDVGFDGKNRMGQVNNKHVFGLELRVPKHVFGLTLQVKE
jgi:hypothetical protein